MTQLVILLLVAAVAIIAFAWRRVNERNKFYMANIGEGVHEGGRDSLFADNAFATRYLVCKRGTDAEHIDVCTASDVPLGVVNDQTISATDLSTPLQVQYFGGALNVTIRLQGSGAIAVDTLLVPDSAGQVKALPAGAGTYYVIGRCLQASSGAGDLLEASPLFFKIVTP